MKCGGRVPRPRSFRLNGLPYFDMSLGAKFGRASATKGDEKAVNWLGW